MRRIAIINQKGGVGKTTTAANLGAALARMGRRVVVIDLDPQANLSIHLGAELFSEEPSTYTILTGSTPFEAALRPTSTPGLRLVPAHIDLSGAELELASSIGRESLLRDALDDWETAAVARSDETPADYVLVDCPPSLGLLSVNALVASKEVVIALQTEFFALQGMSKLVEVVQLLRRRMNPELAVTGILPCLYDSRLRLAREVLAEIKRFFPGEVFQTAVRTNVKLAEAPSHGLTIFEYDPSSTGARDHLLLAEEILAQEGRDADLAARQLAIPRVEELEAAIRDLARSAPPARPEPRPGSTPVQSRPAQTDQMGPIDTTVTTPLESSGALAPEADRAPGSDHGQILPRKAPEEPLAALPTDPPARPSYNYGGLLGEDRPQMAGPRGPSPRGLAGKA